LRAGLLKSNETASRLHCLPAARKETVRCPGESLPAFGGFRQLASPSPEAKAFCGQPLTALPLVFKVNKNPAAKRSQPGNILTPSFTVFFEALIKTCDIQFALRPFAA
jgi:hypothetical protein